MSNDPETQRISYVQSKYVDELMAKPHVVGVGIGMKQTGGTITNQPALVVMVDEKVSVAELADHERIPSELEGVPVDVQETGAFTAN